MPGSIAVPLTTRAAGSAEESIYSRQPRVELRSQQLKRELALDRSTARLRARVGFHGRKQSFNLIELLLSL